MRRQILIHFFSLQWYTDKDHGLGGAAYPHVYTHMTHFLQRCFAWSALDHYDISFQIHCLIWIKQIISGIKSNCKCRLIIIISAPNQEKVQSGSSHNVFLYLWNTCNTSTCKMWFIFGSFFHEFNFWRTWPREEQRCVTALVLLGHEEFLQCSIKWCTET